MAKKTEKKKLEKSGWISSFTLVGEAKINDYTYKIDEKSSKSDWIYNHLNLGVDCGTNGTIYAELMGGYGENRDNVIFVHGKSEDGKDDFKNKYEIDWDDRFDDNVISDIGDMCYINIGLEKDSNKKTFTKKFLTPYDAISYIKENLEDGMVVNVKGNIKYSLYDNKVTVKKEINSIYLSNVENKSDYKAVFTQTMLLTRDSVGKFDKDTGMLPITAKILEYFKNWNEKEVKTFVPLTKIFDYELDVTNEELTKKIIDKLFKVKKGLTEITFEGDITESGSLVTITYDDLPDDIKELVDIGAYTKEEAISKCAENTSKIKRMIIRKPLIKMVGEEGSKTPIIQKFEEKYSEEDLILDFMFSNSDDDNDDDDNNDSKDNSIKSSDDSDNSMAWLDALGITE